LAIVIVLFAIVLTAVVRFPHKAPLWLFCAGVAMAAISYAGGLGQKIAMLHTLWPGRYALAPQALFDLCLLSWCVLHRGRVRFWAGCAVAWLIIMCVWDYRVAQSGPPWAPEVVKWQQDKSYALKIWPSGWTMTLPGK
jgi:hypothetical protein